MSNFKYDHIIPTGVPRNWSQIPNMTDRSSRGQFFFPSSSSFFSDTSKEGLNSETYVIHVIHYVSYDSLWLIWLIMTHYDSLWLVWLIWLTLTHMTHMTHYDSQRLTMTHMTHYDSLLTMTHMAHYLYIYKEGESVCQVPASCSGVCGPIWLKLWWMVG